MPYDAGTVTSTLDLDRSPFITSLEKGRREGAKFARESFKAALGADVRGLQRALRSARSELASFQRERYFAALGADPSEVISSVRQASSKTEAFARQSYEAVLGVKASEVREGVTAADQLAEKFARQTYQATVGVKGGAKSSAELKAVDKAADSVDGRDINLDVDRDGSGAAGVSTLSEGFKGLASSIRATKTVLLAASIPFTIAAIGAAAPSVVTLSASAAGLALNLGKAAVGFGLVGAAAAGGAITGLKAYGAGIAFVVSQAATLRETMLTARTALDSANSAVDSAKEAVKDAKPGTEAYVLAQQQLTTALQQQAAASREWRRAQMLNTPAAREFGGELRETMNRLTRLQAAVGSRVFPKFTSELDAWNEIITQFQPEIVATSESIATIATNFTRWFRTARDGKVLENTVSFINLSATKGATALSQLGQIGISAFQPLIPMALSLQDNFLGILSAVNKWVQSAQGQKRLGGIYRSLWSDANTLWGILLKVGKAVFNVFEAVDESGLADQATNGLSILANGLDRITEKGSTGRQKLNAFLNDAKRLMPFVGRTAVELASQFGRVVSKVIDFREKGHKLTTLQEIFRGIKRSASPMADLLIGTFEDLGPEIAKLIPRLTEFLTVFVGSSGPLVTFVKVLNRSLKIFNDLPPGIKSTVANLAAIKLMLDATGASSLIGGFTNLASSIGGSLLQYKLLKKALGRGTLAVPDISTAPATGPSTKALWASRLAVLASAVGLITIAVTFDYSGARKKGREAIENARADGKLTGDEFTDAMAKAVNEGMKGVPLIGGMFNWITKNIILPGDKQLGKWDPIDYWFHTRILGHKPPKGLGVIGRGLMEAVIGGMKGVPIFGPLLSQLDFLTRVGKRKAEKGKQVGQTFSSRIVDGLKSVPIIGPVVALLDRLFGNSERKVKSQRWKGLGVGAVAKIVDGFLTGGLITGTIGLINRWFGRSKRERESQAWKPLGSSAAADLLKGFVGGGLLGGAVTLIARWFTRSKRKRESQRWKPLGAGAIADVLKGFMGGGLISGALTLIERWFGRSKRKREGQRWKPLGDSAAADILKGFVTGGLVGGALSLIDRWFSKSKRKRDGQRWKPIGVGAAADILGGFLGGGLIAGAIRLVGSWFSKSKNEADKHRWKPVGGGAAALILTGFTKAGLIAGTVSLIASWFSRAKDKRESQDWKGIGLGAAAKTVGGFVAGGIPGVVADVIRKAADRGEQEKPKFEKSGKDSARGFCKGFGIVDLGKCMVDHVKGAWQKVRKWGGEDSPWRRTMASGINAARGFAIGLLKDGGLAERNAKTLAGRVAKAIRDGVVDLGDVPGAVWDQLLKRGWVGRASDNRERVYRPGGGFGTTPAERARQRRRAEGRNAYQLDPLNWQRAGRTRVRTWDMGSPHDMVSTILNSKADSIGKSWARYLVHHLNRMPDAFRTRRRDDIQRLAPRLRELGFEGFQANLLRRTHRGGADQGVESDVIRARRRQERINKQIRDGIVNLNDVNERVWNRLTSRGWQGDPRDNAERLYAPRNLRRRGMVQAEDGSWVPPSFFGGVRGPRTADKRLGNLMDRLTSAVFRSEKEATVRLRREIELTQTAQQLARVRQGAADAGPGRRLEILRGQAEIARRLGRDRQVRSLRQQIEQTEQERRRQQEREGSEAKRNRDQQRPREAGPAVPGLARPGERTREPGRDRRGAPAGITVSEFRAALKEHTRDLAKLLRAGMADAPNLAAFQRQMDKALGGFIGYRNGMGAQPQ